MSGLPSSIHAVTVAVSVAAAAAVLVVTATVRRNRSPGSTPIVLPGLKPNQPNQRMKQPIVAAVMLWPGMACDLAVGAVLADARAEHDDAQPGRPNRRWSAPASSRRNQEAPVAASQPPPQIQCPTTG